MRDYLDKTKPHLHVALIYDSNIPLTSQALEDLENLKNEFPELEIVAGDDSKDPRLGKYYGIKATPQFNLCIYGMKLTHQVGNNFKVLKEKLEKVIDIKNKNGDLEVQTYKPYDMFLRDKQTEEIIRNGHDLIVHDF